MEGNTFDRITKRLGTDASRRQMLGGLIGTTAAVLAGAVVAEAKPHKNKNKGKAKDRNRARKQAANDNGNNGRGAGTEKVQICHRNNGKKGPNLITVGAPAVPAHERHGDTVCEQVACQTIAGCAVDDDGAITCTYEAVADEDQVACSVDGDAGTCVGGECVTEDGGDGENG
jgi:hypothetical protein